MATIPLDNAALRTILRHIDACHDARQWSRNLDLRTAWMTCERGDHLIWFAARLRVNHKRVVYVACQCARLELPYVPAGEDRPRQLIELVEAWCRGEVTTERMRIAAYSTYADANAYAAYSAAIAAYDATYGYDNDAYAADVAYAVTYAVTSAADAHANAEDADNARANTLRQCADLVRQAIPYRTIAAAAQRMLKLRAKAA